MSPERMAGLAYWASGGDVIGRGGVLPVSRAFDLLRFLADEAKAQREAGDAGVAQLLASVALDLGSAIARAATWRRAGCF